MYNSIIEFIEKTLLKLKIYQRIIIIRKYDAF